MKSEYIEYLKSHEWQKLRLELMNDAEWICEDCGGKAIELHHLSYENLGFEELGFDVIPLCLACHKDRHLEKNSMSGYGDYGE